MHGSQAIHGWPAIVRPSSGHLWMPGHPSMAPNSRLNSRKPLARAQSGCTIYQVRTQTAPTCISRTVTDRQGSMSHKGFPRDSSEILGQAMLFASQFQAKNVVFTHVFHSASMSIDRIGNRRAGGESTHSGTKQIIEIFL